MIIADSDVLIDALRGRNPSAAKLRELLLVDTLATTVISCFELLSGAKTERELGRVSALLGPLDILPVDEQAAAAGARRTLEAVGLTIGAADYLVAGVCISRSLGLLTRNRKHFERVPGLLLAEL